jgi:hypothetical protein
MSALALAFAPDGQTLAVGGDVIRLLDWRTGNDKLPHLAQPVNMFSTVLTPDGRTVATAVKGAIQLWDATTGRPRQRLTAHADRVPDLHMLGAGRTLLSAGSDNTLRLWDLDTVKERRRLDAPKEGLIPLAITADGATMACAPDDDCIQLVDLATGKPRSRLRLKTQSLTGAAFAPDGRTLIVWHNDQTAAVWDLASHKEVRRFPFVAPSMVPPPAVGNPSRVGVAYAACVSPDGRWLAYGDQHDQLAIHELATGKVVRLVRNLRDGAGTLAFSPDSRSLAWSSWRQPAVHLLELASGKVRRRFDGHRGRVTSLAYAASGRTLVSSSQDATALVWDVQSSRAAPRAALDRDAAWQALASDDAATAYTVMCRLVAAPDAAVALLRERLTPVPRPSAQRLAQLIADLDSQQFAVRDAARQELARWAETAVPACRAALASATSLELRRRLQGLLDEQRQEAATPGPDRLRLLRAVEVLELVGTAAGRALLQQLADGAAGATLTEEAKSSLQRLERFAPR